MGAEQEAIVRSLFDCLVAEDWDGAADHYAVDATHTNPAWREPIVGRAAIRVDEERTGSLYTNFRYRIVNMASTDSVVLTERIGIMTMANRDITMHLATVHELDSDGKVSASRVYVDLKEIEAQLA
jgi:limonene-1,2-epoxide hydrolase